MSILTFTATTEDFGAHKTSNSIFSAWSKCYFRCQSVCAALLWCWLKKCLLALICLAIQGTAVLALAVHFAALWVWSSSWRGDEPMGIGQTNSCYQENWLVTATCKTWIVFFVIQWVTIVSCKHDKVSVIRNQWLVPAEDGCQLCWFLMSSIQINGFRLGNILATFYNFVEYLGIKHIICWQEKSFFSPDDLLWNYFSFFQYFSVCLLELEFMAMLNLAVPEIFSLLSMSLMCV